MAQFGFYMDLTRCTGCKTCELACKDYQDLPTDRNFRRIYEYAGGNWQNKDGVWSNDVFAYYVSIACNHCEKPACLESCPVSAISKDENGMVLIDEAKCIGCGSCRDVCPYNAPQFDKEREKMTKCDGCKDLTKDGKKPICVDACPLRALEYGPIADLRKQHGDVVEVAPLPIVKGKAATEPSIVIKPSSNSKPSGDESGKIANPLEV